MIYINNLPDGSTSICKIFADDTSVFSEVIDTRNSQNALNSDLESISNWAYQWKLQFNIDPKKQVNKVIFSCKWNTCMYPPVTFNNNGITKCPHWKHLGVVLDPKLEVDIHIEQKTKKCNKIIGLLRRLSTSLPQEKLYLLFTNC